MGGQNRKRKERFCQDKKDMLFENLIQSKGIEEEQKGSHVESSRGAVAEDFLGAMTEEGEKTSMDREVKQIAKLQEDLQLKEERIQSELATIETQVEMVGKEVKSHRSNLTTAEEKHKKSVNEKVKAAMEIEALQYSKKMLQRQLEVQQKLMTARWGLEAAIQANDAKNKEIEELKFQVAERDETISKDREVILMLKKIDGQDEAEKKLAVQEERITALRTEMRELVMENKGLHIMNTMFEKQAETHLKTEKAKLRLQFEDERKKLEEKLDQVCASEKAKVAKIQECWQAAEKGLKTKVREADHLRTQNKTLSTEKTKMQSQLVKAENQLKGFEENLSLEKSKSAAAEKEMNRLHGVANQVESMEKRLMREQGQRKAAKEELTRLKHREEELSKFVQQVTSAGENILKSRQEHQNAGVDAEDDQRRHDEQGAGAEEPPKSVSSTHVRLVEKLLKQIKHPPISTADCSRLVHQLRAAKGKLSGLPMEVIEEEVRKMALEEAEVKAKECPICFDPMVSKLLHCKQCNQAFHYRCWKKWAQSKELHPEATECPVCRTSNCS